MNTYKRHRFPTDIISYAVWLYYRFNLSHRDVGDLLAERGIFVSCETIRLWCTILVQKEQASRARSLMGLLRHLDKNRAGDLQELIESVEL